jgi:hypothetical protein
MSISAINIREAPRKHPRLWLRQCSTARRRPDGDDPPYGVEYDPESLTDRLTVLLGVYFARSRC